MRITKIALILFILGCVFQSFVQSKPIQLTDATGRRVELTQIPQRLVVVGRAPFMVLHLLYAFAEGRQRLIGAENVGTTVSDFLPLVDPSFAVKASLFKNPGVEQIAALKPDLAIMKGTTTDLKGEALVNAGIQTLYLALETPQQFARDAANLGLVLGNSKRANEILAFYQKRLDRLRKGLAGLKDSQKPRVLLMEYSDRGGKMAVRVPAKSWMQTIEVQTAGGNPVWLEAAQDSDGYTVVNFEQIARWNPDKIFAVVWYTLNPQEAIRDLKTDPQWRALKAVASGQPFSECWAWALPASWDSV